MKRKIKYLLVFIVLIMTLALYLSNKIIDDSANGKLYSDAASIPYNKVGLLLGTSKYLPDGRANPFYSNSP
ncbi:MAG: hypothetical protein JST96_17300 [Bacteroidetes bacterium]|nr:hypothetical protein [Bacteroidota bacterium]